MARHCNKCRYDAPEGPRGYERECPKCGTTYPLMAGEVPAPVAAPVRKAVIISGEMHDRSTWQWAIVLGIFLVLGLMILRSVTPTSKDSVLPSLLQQPRTAADVYLDNASAIRARCHRAIEASLHDPGSVQWDKEFAVDHATDWQVRYQFRAKNGFGAMRLNGIKCTVNKSTMTVTGLLPDE